MALPQRHEGRGRRSSAASWFEVEDFNPFFLVCLFCFFEKNEERVRSLSLSLNLSITSFLFLHSQRSQASLPLSPLSPLSSTSESFSELTLALTAKLWAKREDRLFLKKPERRTIGASPPSVHRNLSTSTSAGALEIEKNQKKKKK